MKSSWSARGKERFKPLNASDLASVDIGLPKMDGRAIMERLCEQGLDTISIYIAWTKFGQQPDVQTSIKGGFRHHITQPVNAVDLDATLHLATRFQERRQDLNS